MKLIIVIVGMLGILFLVAGYVTAQNPDSDVEASATIPFIFGLCFLGVDAVLTLGYAFYRLIVS